MVYIATLSDGTDALFISNKSAFQWITLASHMRQLPERRKIWAAWVIGKILYVGGPGWTYAFSDNTALPVTWAPPSEVDGRIGPSGPLCVAANSSLGYAWVANTSGLYLLQGGAFPALPISYLQTPDWERINWSALASAPAALQVLDVPSLKLVLIRAPLDAATSSSHILAWSYANGKTWDKVDFSLWSSAAWTDIGAMTMVFNNSKRLYELWLSRYGAGKVYRRKSTQAGDSNLYNDDSLGIDSLYRAAAMPQVFPEPIAHIAVQPRLRGSGTILQTAKTLDGGATVNLASITASATPGKWPLTMCDVQSEAAHYSWSNNAVANSYFIVSAIKSYFQNWLNRR
jgi:hypothetical protein